MSYLIMENEKYWKLKDINTYIKRSHLIKFEISK